MMSRKLIKTEDGSHSIYVEELKEHYHSAYGAINESLHIYIKNGFHFIRNKEINILEMGFGTGLNAFLTLIEAKKTNKKVNYFGIEKYPLETSEWNVLNYPELFKEVDKELFIKLHSCKWEVWNSINKDFFLYKSCTDLRDFTSDMQFDLIYFDAFAPEVQPDLWKTHIFRNMFKRLKNGGALVSYSVKGLVRRNLTEAGFSCEKLPGPKGKRQIIRALKNY